MTLSRNVKEEVNKESEIKSWTERGTKNGKLINRLSMLNYLVLLLIAILLERNTLKIYVQL